MRILCVIDSLGSGGAQRQLVELAKGFKEKGHEVSFLTYHAINFFKQELDNYHIPVVIVLEGNYLKRLMKIRFAIQEINPEAVLSFLEATNFIVTLAGIPFRKWSLVVGERSSNPMITSNFKLRFFRFFHIFVDYIVSNSHRNIQLVKKANPFIRNKKLKVIYNIARNCNVIHTQYSERHFTTILVAASYREVKNLHGLIMAVNLLPPEYKSKLKIQWYGNISMDNDYYAKNCESIRQLELDRIFILNDQVTNIHEKYQEADFIGLFSHYEGFPNSICEAMILRKPVIVSKVSDIPLIIIEGENGFLCDSEDIISIKNAIIKSINSSLMHRAKMGKYNYEIAKSRFEKELIVDNYLQLFGIN